MSIYPIYPRIFLSFSSSEENVLTVLRDYSGRHSRYYLQCQISNQDDSLQGNSLNPCLLYSLLFKKEGTRPKFLLFFVCLLICKDGDRNSQMLLRNPEASPKDTQVNLAADSMLSWKNLMRLRPCNARKKGGNHTLAIWSWEANLAMQDRSCDAL